MRTYQHPGAVAVYPFLILLALVRSVSPAQTSPGFSKMTNTKHNLSIFGPGPIKSSTETNLCVFCHTPHVPTGYSADQLWNHQLTAATYELYSSDYLTNLNYAPPNQPNPRSKLCLSCHDGTIALGAVYNNGGGSMTIQMDNAVTAMPSNAPGNLGTSLANDHPVGFMYDNGRDPELVGRQWPWNTPVKLDPDLASGTIECQTCHDPHDDTNVPFLRVSNTNAALCTSCHNKSGWADAAHKTSTQAFTPTGHPGTTVGEWACRSCHTAHNGEGVPYLLTKVEEKTCYESGCHGSASTGLNTKNIQTAMEKQYAHPTSNVVGMHKDPDVTASLDVSHRHAECQDCHNSHRAKKGLHTVGSNAVSDVLQGVQGVLPTFTGNWQQPTSYASINPVVQESQICFKCHSSNAFGIVANGVTTILTSSGIKSTDQAMEFSPANRSAHPVVSALGDQSGSLPPMRLDQSQLTAEWNATGTQTMYCSDCHGSDEVTSQATPQGPHGSTSKYMLTGKGQFWPTDRDGSLWSLADIKNGAAWQNDLFCANCHPMMSAGTFVNAAHNGIDHQTAAVKCITCHVAVPHGAKRSRLIGYASDVAPYNYNGAGFNERLMVTGFRKGATPLDYDESSCSTNGVCHAPQPGPFEP